MTSSNVSNLISESTILKCWDGSENIGKNCDNGGIKYEIIINILGSKGRKSC